MYGRIFQEGEKSNEKTNLLELGNNLLELLNTSLLHLSSTQSTLPILSRQLLHFGIILFKETQVLIRDIHIRVPAILFVVFLRRTTTGEGVGLDFFGDLFSIVCHKDGGVLLRGGHLGTGTLEGWEEFGVKESRFLVAQSVGRVSGEEELE